MKAKTTNYKRKLSALNNERTTHMFSLLQGKPMVHGLPHSVFRKCGKPNCKCVRGRLHGPYPAISVNKEGKQKMVMVKKTDSAVVKKSKRYRYYQRTLARIRKINREIDELLEKIKEEMLESYP
jgi:hypothetical protein